MKAALLIFSLILLVACGKNNESGKSKTIFPQNPSPYTDSQLELIRQDFIREGKHVLTRYEDVMKEMFGARTVGLIRGRLRHENVQVTESLLFNDRNVYSRSTNRNSLITLYIGRDQADLSWASYHQTRPTMYTRLVMHELLLLGEVADNNFIFTDRILRR